MSDKMSLIDMLEKFLSGGMSSKIALDKCASRKNYMRLDGLKTLDNRDTFIYVPQPEPEAEFAPLFDWVADWRKDGLKIDKHPIVRIGDGIMFDQFTGSTRSRPEGTLMHDVREIWLNSEAKGLAEYGSEYLNSTYVHECVHYRQACEINWDLKTACSDQEYIYRIELEAYKAQRAYLESVGAKGYLTGIDDTELERRIRLVYVDEASDISRAYSTRKD